MDISEIHTDIALRSRRQSAHAKLGSVTRMLLLTILVSSLPAALASCGKVEPKAVDVGLLSTDVHVAIGQHNLVLPFIALEDYAYRKQSFSLDRKRDSEHALDALNQLLIDSADPKKPLVLDGLSVVVGTYGWDGDGRQKQVCTMLTREWARSVCDNPWAAIQQALPANRFRLVDLHRLQVGGPQGPASCRDGGKARPLPKKPKEAVMVCEAPVYGGENDKFHLAVIRIDGNLGALWIVWRYGQEGETAEEMTEREGKAIVAFVHYAVGKSEDFPKLHADMCGLRRPGSSDHPHGADCRRAAQPSLGRHNN